MAAEILFSGGRMDSVRVVAGSPVDLNTAGRFDSAYADAFVYCVSGQTVAADFFTATSNILSAATVVSGETLWVHFEHHATAVTSTTVVSLWTIFDSSGFPWVSVRVAGASLIGLYYNSGTGASPTWTLLGSTVSVVDSTLQSFDLSVTIGATNTATLYRGGSSIATGTFTQALFTNAASLQLTARAAGGYAYSQIMATRDISTVGSKVRTMRGTGAGSNSGWTGAVTDVNEVIGSDATINSAASAGLKQSYAMTDVTVGSGFEVRAVFHWMRAKNDGSAPKNIKSLVRSGGTDYSTGNLAGIGLGFAAIGARYDQDPATSANWTDAGLDAVEFGFESAT